MPGPRATTVIVLAKLDQPVPEQPYSIPPAFVSGSGSVINSAANDATLGSTLRGTATVLSPAPARNAAMPAIAAAPDFPSEPPTISAWPYIPLFESIGRGASRREKVARGRHLQIQRRDDRLVRAADRHNDNRPAREHAEDMCRTRRGECHDSIGARDAFAGLRVHRIGFGSRRNIDRDDRLAAAVHRCDRLGVEALHRRLKSGSQDGIDDQVAVRHCARKLCRQLL